MQLTLEETMWVHTFGDGVPLFQKLFPNVPEVVPKCPRKNHSH